MEVPMDGLYRISSGFGAARRNDVTPRSHPNVNVERQSRYAAKPPLSYTYSIAHS